MFKCVKKKSSITPERTAFTDMHLHAKQLMGIQFSQDVSHSKLGLKCRRLLHKRLNFDSFNCDKHKKSVLQLFNTVCFQKYFEAVLTFLNRILGG